MSTDHGPVSEGGAAAERVETIVLVHGLGSSSTFWENLVPDLATQFQVVTPNLLGHGPGASRPAVIQSHPRELAGSLIEQLRSEGIDNPHLVGLSLGGWVVLEMAAQGFGRSVVGLAPAGLWAGNGKARRERATSVLRTAIPPAERLLSVMARSARVKHFGLRALVREPDRVSNEQFQMAVVALGQARGYRVCDRVAVRTRFLAGGKVQVPTTVAFGDHDLVLPASTSQNRSLLPDHARFLIVPDCGHAVSWDRPDACLHLIRETTAAPGSAAQRPTPSASPS
jgi:pimeloyl-ACP methyl ester carboxylesterase